MINPMVLSHARNDYRILYIFLFVTQMAGYHVVFLNLSELR
jgi:hypothetical protein